jgi:uncharacterized protein YegP (UPF0339 family)
LENIKIKLKERFMSAKFTVFKDKAGNFRFNLKASNGEIIAACSEGYHSKKSALKGIASIVKSSAVAAIVDTTVEEKDAKKPAGKPVAKTKTAAKPKE